MTLEQQFCSLELAKRLKELGVKQESCFWWCDPSDGDKADVGFIRDNHVGYKVFYSAFTVAELGLLLPWAIESNFLEDPDKWLKIEKDENVDGSTRWNVGYQDEMSTDLFEVSDQTEADARAKTLIYLLENKIITL